MSQILDILPQVEGEEMLFLQNLIAPWSEEQARRFAAVYSTRRRDSTTMLLLALVGFIGVAGIHRFLLGQIGMGVLYLLTGGLCYIGTIVDIVNIKKMTQTANIAIASEIAQMIQ